MKGMLSRLLLAVLASALPLLAQAEYRVYNDHPRLFLDADRLKRLQREAERETGRWKQLREQIHGGAAMPERPVALALAYRIEGDEAAGRAALDAVAGADAASLPLRHFALVYDWCYPLLSAEQRAALARALTDAAGRRRRPPRAHVTWRWR